MNNLKVPGPRLLTFLLVLTAAAILSAATATMINNSIRSAPLYLFLLFFGSGIVLALGPLRGGLGSLAALFAWIYLKREMGTWLSIDLTGNLIELASLLAALGFSALYGSLWRRAMQAGYSSIQRLDQLNVEDKQVGLIKPTYGRLRLVEEEERSVRYRRPFSLILIQLQPNSPRDFAPGEEAVLMRVVGNAVKAITRKTDIPFLATSDKVALILPETDIRGADKVVRNVMKSMRSTHFMEAGRARVFLQERVQLHYGFSSFTGTSQVPIHLLEAAETSLEAALAKPNKHTFQNLTSRWIEIGDAPEPALTISKMLEITAHYAGFEHPTNLAQSVPGTTGKLNAWRKIDSMLNQLSLLVKEVRPESAQLATVRPVDAPTAGLNALPPNAITTQLGSGNGRKYPIPPSDTRTLHQ